MNIVISSCKAFANTSLPPLFESLDKAGVPRNDLTVVWDGPGGLRDDVYYIESPLRCYEMNGPLAFVLGLPKQPFFAIHDTCLVTEGFYRNVLEGMERFQAAGADVGGSFPEYMHCCMGYFRPLFVLQNWHPIFDELHGQGKRAAVDFEVNARLLQLAGDKYMGMGWGIQDGIRHVDIYQTGHPRWERYFPGLGLYKYTLSNTIEGVSPTPVI